MFKPISVIAAVVLIGAFESPGHADEVTARGILTKWLQDAGAQADTPPNSTATPFDYRTMGVKKQCDGTVRNPKALASWWKCFRKAEDYLLTDFQNGGDIEPPSPKEPLPKSLRAAAKHIKTPGTWAEGVFVGDGMTSQFLFLTTKSGQIAALIVDVTFF
jgi:hypothetical protein